MSSSSKRPIPIAGHVPFCVLDKTHCLWSWEPKADNRRFLSGFDADYFVDVAEMLANNLGGEKDQKAATAIKLNYMLAIETLFSLVGASIQAPVAIGGWLLHSKTGDIRCVAKSLQDGSFTYPVGWEQLPSPLSFRTYSEVVMQASVWRQDPEDRTVENFAKSLSRMATDFLDEHHILEFNSLKHGFRARAGGFTLEIGEEPALGVSPPKSEMKPFGSSRYGTTFPRAVGLRPDATIGKNPHFRMVDSSLNWSAEQMVQRTQIASITMQNIVSMLKIANGALPGETKFVRPASNEFFDAAWKADNGAYQISLSVHLGLENIENISAQDLQAELVAMRKT